MTSAQDLRNENSQPRMLPGKKAPHGQGPEAATRAFWKHGGETREAQLQVQGAGSLLVPMRAGPGGAI